MVRRVACALVWGMVLFARPAGAFDAQACLASDLRAQQTAASDRAMAAALREALGTVDVPPAVSALYARLIVAAGLGAPRDFMLVGVDGPAFAAHAAAPNVVLLSKAVWTDAASTDEIAAVLAHELSHLRARHAQIAGCRALRFVDDDRWDVGRALQAVLRVAKTEPAVASAWNAMLRRFEFEADAAALDVLRAADIDPRALLRLLARVDAASHPAEGADDATHPSPRARIDALERQLAHPTQTARAEP